MSRYGSRFEFRFNTLVYLAFLKAKSLFKVRSCIRTSFIPKGRGHSNVEKMVRVLG